MFYKRRAFVTSIRFFSSAMKRAICFGIIAALHTGCTAPSAPTQPRIAYPEVPRVEPVSLDTINEQQKMLVGIIDGQPLPGRAKSNLFMSLMHNADLFEHYRHIGDRVSSAPEIPDKQRELVILRVSWLYQGKYEWSQHYPKALEYGWSRDDIERLKIGAVAPGWSDLDKTLLKATDQLVQQAGLDDETWDTLSEYYSLQEIMTLITVITHYHWVAMMSKTLGVQPNKTLEGFH